MLLDVRKAIGRERSAVQAIFIAGKQPSAAHKKAVIGLGIDKAVTAGRKDRPILTDVQRVRARAQANERISRDQRFLSAPM
jgi:hypothetical protein